MDKPRFRVGVLVRCTVCGRPKKPFGRDQGPHGADCHDDGADFGCQGYFLDPKPDNLWPGEKGWLPWHEQEPS